MLRVCPPGDILSKAWGSGTCGFSDQRLNHSARNLSMANKLQLEWKKIKDPLQKQVDTFKKTKSGWNTAPLEQILKKMNLNFGDTLGKAGDAFKANKGDDVAKYCKRAVQIAETY